MGADDVAAGRLTERQEQVIRLIASGKTNFEVAQTLGITLDGAKWHLREIMARFGCDTREEAVAIWKSRRPKTARRLLAPAAWKVVGVGAAALAGAAIIALVVASRATDPGSQADQANLVGIPDPAPTSRPQAIGLRHCGTSTFRRPPISQMQQAFTNPRFAYSAPVPVERPAPWYFSFYLTNVYRVTPRAVSANVENVALSGVQQNGDATVLIPPTITCDEAFRQDRTLDYYEYWFIDLLPKAAVLEGPTLTIHVEDLPGSFTDVTLPDPPVLSSDAVSGLPPFRELRVIDDSGELRYTDGAEGTAQYARDGSLVFAMSTSSEARLQFEVRGAPQVIVAYVPLPPAAPPTRATATSAMVVSDSAGHVLPSAVREQAPAGWEEVFRRELPPGVYSFEKGWILVLPANTPLP
jgi:DNA-binding CsgD family transcriptional regulator